MKSKLMKALSWAVFPALLVAGFAIAAPGDDSGSGGSGGSGDGGQSQEDFTVPAGPPDAGVIGFAGPGGPGGPGGVDGEVISGELHVLRDGEVVTVFMDRGTVSAVSDTAVTITREDDTEVDIPVDGETEVIRPPDEPPNPEDWEDGPPQFDPIEPGDVGDLEVGDQVIAHHDDGAAADLIAVIPDWDRIPMGPPGGFGPGGFGPPGDMEPPSEGGDA